MFLAVTSEVWFELVPVQLASQFIISMKLKKRKQFKFCKFNVILTKSEPDPNFFQSFFSDDILTWF